MGEFMTPAPISQTVAIRLSQLSQPHTRCASATVALLPFREERTDCCAGAVRKNLKKRLSQIARLTLGRKRISSAAGTKIERGRPESGVNDRFTPAGGRRGRSPACEGAATAWILTHRIFPAVGSSQCANQRDVLRNPLFAGLSSILHWFALSTHLRTGANLKPKSETISNRFARTAVRTIGTPVGGGRSRSRQPSGRKPAPSTNASFRRF